MNEQHSLERIRWTLSLLGLALLLLGLYTVLRPFLIPIGWAMILVLTTWPIHRRILALMPRAPAVAAFISTLLLAVVILAAVTPLLIAFSGELRHTLQKAQSWLASDTSGAPGVVGRIPLIGPMLGDKLMSAREESRQLMDLADRYSGDIFRFATLAARGLFQAIFKIGLCLFTCYFFYRWGIRLERQVGFAVSRLGGQRFMHLLQTSKATVKGAVYGVLATALAQGVLAGLGYIAAGAPFPLVFAFATMVFTLVPFGPPLVYLPVSIYIMAEDGRWLPGLLLMAWGVGVVSTVDNFLRPYFISQATRAPVLLVFFGVLGGVLSFGLIGIVIGPVILAIAQALWLEWATPERRELLDAPAKI